MKYFLLSVLFLFCSFSVFADAPDMRIKRQLDAEGVNYKISKNGDFIIDLDTKNGRTQRLLLFSATENYNGIRLRQISSNGYIGKISPSMARELLKQSFDKKMGAWTMFTADGKDFATFTLIFIDNVSSGDLVQLLRYVANAADAFEAANSSSDNL